MLGFAIKLTVRPAEMSEADLAPLRAAGFSDRDILDIVVVSAYYAFAIRIAEVLGLQPEPWIPEDS